jgi:hypothetical protein
LDEGGGEVLGGNIEGDEGEGVGGVLDVSVDAKGRKGSITSSVCGYGKNRASVTEG